MTNRAARSTSVLFLSAISWAMMGNEGCEQNSARRLKMEVEIGTVDARAVRLPTGEILDFPFVANSLFYREIMNHGHFNVTNPVLSAPPPKVMTATTMLQTANARLGNGQMVYSAQDLGLLSRFGMRVGGKTFSASGVGTLAAPSEVACLVDRPQALVKGEILSFAMTWGVGLGVGYGRGGIELPVGNVGGSVDFKQSELELGLRTDDPLSGRVDVIADAVAYKSDLKLSIDFSAGLPLGLSFFMNEPMTNVIRSGYQKALNQIVSAYIKNKATKGKWNEVWSSRVITDPAIANNDTHVAFRGGQRSNIREGDIFEIHQMRYQWKGEACKSNLDYQIPTSNTALAIIKVVGVGDMVSVGEVIQSPNNRPIQTGDRVRLVLMAEDVTAK